MKRPEIFDHHDYREFLKLWLSYRKFSQSSFSLRNLARVSGLSPSYLSMIINGERGLNLQNLEKLAPHLKLSREELSYLEALIQVSDGSDHQERAQGLKKLRRFERYRQRKHQEAEAFQYLQNWYNVVIRELSENIDFEPSPSWIRQRLRLPVETWQIQQSLRFLLDNGFILKDEKTGRLKSSEKSLRCEKGIFKVSLREFHQQMLELAGQSIDELSSQERMIMGYTASLSKKEFEKATEILADCIKNLEELKAQSKDEKSKEVYHFIVSGVPMTKKKAQGDQK